MIHNIQGVLDPLPLGKYPIKKVIMNNDLVWLLEWYNKQCDGDWEHGNGIKIGTIDNPGWYLKVSLAETEIENQNFETIDINRSNSNWIYCSKRESMFEGFGGPFNLPEILHIFRNWAENHQV